MRRGQERADDRSGPARPVGEEVFARALDDRQCKDRPHGGAHRLDRERVDAVADQDDATDAGGVGGADDGAEIARIAHLFQGHPGVVAIGVDIGQTRHALGEDRDDHLRIVLARDLFEDFAGDLKDLAAGVQRLANGAVEQGMRVAVLAIGEDARGNTLIERIDDDLQAFGQEKPGLLAFLAHMQGADVLDRLVGQRGDFPDHTCHLTTATWRRRTGRSRAALSRRP